MNFEVGKESVWVVARWRVTLVRGNYLGIQGRSWSLSRYHGFVELSCSSNTRMEEGIDDGCSVGTALSGLSDCTNMTFGKVQQFWRDGSAKHKEVNLVDSKYIAVPAKPNNLLYVPVKFNTHLLSYSAVRFSLSFAQYNEKIKGFQQLCYDKCYSSLDVVLISWIYLTQTD